MSKSKKGSAITPDKPVDSDSIMNEIEQENENRTNEEIWTFNRELEINRIVTIAEMRAQRHSTGVSSEYIQDEDKIVERILEAPLPLNNYVDFYDLSDRGSAYLTIFCTRLAVRLMTLNFERKRAWSGGKDAKIKLIDGAIKLITFALNAPTSDKDTIEAQIANYEYETGLCVHRQGVSRSHPHDNQLELRDSAYWKELSEAATKAIDLPADDKKQKAWIIREMLRKDLGVTDFEADVIKKVVDEKVASLEDSSYWRGLGQKACQALTKYPAFELTKNTIKRTENLKQWIKADFKTTDREAEVIKKILKERYKNLR